MSVLPAIPTLLLSGAALGLLVGVALMAWRTPLPVRAEEPVSAIYRRRILGAMLIGASLFLGGFTLAARHPIF